MPALILLGCIVFLIIDYFIAKEFQQVAEMKGHHESKYFWLSFFFVAVGYSLVIALPDRGNVEAKTVDVDELPEL